MAVDNEHISGGEMSSAQPAVPARRFRYSAEPVASPLATLATPLNAPIVPAITGVNWNRIWIVFAAAAVCFLTLYPSELIHLADKWYTDAGWSHGFVVPLISLFFIRLKWDKLRTLVPRGSWIGLAVLFLGVVGQIFFRATGTEHMSHLSILVLMFGIVLFVFGWEYMKILWLPIGYLIFALPPPGPLYVKMTTPMQVIAAELGVRLLPLFGGVGTRDGTTISVIRGNSLIKLDVAQACSGMRMLVAFLALAVALAYSTARPIWQKIALALCALPIAILCNALRVTLTGIIGAAWGQQYAEGTTHETLGLLMLIPAMGMQLGAAWLLDRIFIYDDDKPTGGDKPASGAALQGAA